MFQLLALIIVCACFLYGVDSLIKRDQCAAWTGYYGPAGILNMAELILCPDNLYDKIGKKQAEDIRNELCSVANQIETNDDNYAFQLLNMTGYLDNGTITKLCNMKTIDPITIRNLPPVFPNRDFSNADDDDDFNHLQAYLNKYQKLYENFMNKHISEYRIWTNNLHKYRLIKMMAREYCEPLRNSDNDNDDIPVEKFDDGRLDSVKNHSRFIQCLEGLSNITTIEFVCGMANDNGSDREEYCKKLGKANPSFPLPDPGTTDELYEALRICLENEPVLGDSISYYNFNNFAYHYNKYQMDISAIFRTSLIDPWPELSGGYSGHSSGKFNDHDTMCLSDIPMKISNYFKCYNLTYRYHFHDEYMKCIGLMNISIFDKQSLACNRGFVYLELDNVEDVGMRTEIWECLEHFRKYNNRPYSHCSNSTERVKHRELRTRIASDFERTNACFDESFHANRNRIDAILEKELKLANTVCWHRSDIITDYNISMMSYANLAGKCFIDGPSGTNEEVSNCYNKLSQSLLTKYDTDFVLCVAPDEFINKVCIPITFI